jgi:hypothetical protein
VHDRPIERSILVQRSMNPHFIIVGAKLDEDPAQMCADIHGGPEHNTLQSEAGYLTQDRTSARSTKPSCNARLTIQPTLTANNGAVLLREAIHVHESEHAAFRRRFGPRPRRQFRRNRSPRREGSNGTSGCWLRSPSSRQRQQSLAIFVLREDDRDRKPDSFKCRARAAGCRRAGPTRCGVECAIAA